MRRSAQQKIKGALNGERILPFTALQIANVRLDEHELLKAEASNRLAALSPDERKALAANQHLILVTLSVDDLRAIASYKTEKPPAS